MAMEYKQSILDAHTKAVLCVVYNPVRRELYTGSEDTTIKVWENESGKLLNTFSEHVGWVTNLLYCKELKALFSCSVDGFLIAWGANGKMIQRIETLAPIYSLAYNPRRQQILAGYHGKVRAFQAINAEDAHSTTDILERKSASSTEHTDVVSCIVSCEGRFYSAGYDRKIVIYDSPHPREMKLRVLHTIAKAHDAAISCMMYGKDAENSWLITGSFDRVVKLWSLDGNFLQRFEGFTDTITSLAYVLPTQTLWVTCNSIVPYVYDPRSGFNVSEFVSLDAQRFQDQGVRSGIRNLLFIPDTNEVVGTTSRKGLVVWRYNQMANLTTLHGHVEGAESLTFTAKEPLLIFSGGGNSTMIKWERLQLNTFMYSQELLMMPKEEIPDETPDVTPKRDVHQKRKIQSDLHKRVAEKLLLWKLRAPSTNDDGLIVPRASEMMSGSTSKSFARRERQLQQERGHNGRTNSGNFGDERKRREDLKKQKMNRPSVFKMTYYEELDYLICGFEDSKILVYGYNEEAMKFVPEEKDRDKEEKDTENDPNNNLSNDSVNNRVAGLTCKYTLQDHRDAVTGLACFSHEGLFYLISTGWDRRICIWDLKQGKLHDVFRNPYLPPSKEEIAADGLILDLEICPERMEFAYASADKTAYIRKLSSKGDEMKLVAMLQDHDAEVTQIKWNKVNKQWVTGSEDRTIRIWPAEGHKSIKLLNNESPVTALCIDTSNGCVVSGASDRVIRVFDGEVLVQTNLGHADEVRSLIHMPSRNQYVSASWDSTIRVWNAHMKKGQKKINLNANDLKDSVGNFEVEEEQQPSFADLNPLVIPKILTKPIFAKELTIGKPSMTEDLSEMVEQSRLEDELRSTLNELELALGANDRNNLNKKSRPAGQRQNLQIPAARTRYADAF